MLVISHQAHLTPSDLITTDASHVSRNSEAFFPAHLSKEQAHACPRSTGERNWGYEALSAGFRVVLRFGAWFGVCRSLDAGLLPTICGNCSSVPAVQGMQECKSICSSTYTTGGHFARGRPMRICMPFAKSIRLQKLVPVPALVIMDIVLAVRKRQQQEPPTVVALLVCTEASS